MVAALAAMAVGVVMLGIWGSPALGAEKPAPTAAPGQSAEKKMKEPMAVIKTKFGELEIKFFPDLAPKHVENFIKLAKGGVYNGTNYTGTVTVNTTIGGTVRGLPGTTYYGFGFGMPQVVYGSLDTMGPLLAGQPYPGYGGDRFLVALRANADWRAAKADVLALGASNVQVAAEQIEQLRSNPVFRAFFGFIELEMAFMVVILTAGLGVILYAATLERDVELAAIRARGASGWQTAGLLVGEAASIMLIGLIVGTGIGILAAYLSTSFIAAGPGTAGESLVPVLFILPPEALLLLVLAPAAMLLTSFAVTIRIARMDIARVLKLRGG